MPAENRDTDLVKHILRYCNQIETAHQDFGNSRLRFDESTTYQNAVSMCILQIGELVGHLSETFRDANTDIPWHKIRGMRNYVAHEYGSIDLDIVWYASTVSIPELKQFCTEYISLHSSGKD